MGFHFSCLFLYTLRPVLLHCQLSCYTTSASANRRAQRLSDRCRPRPATLPKGVGRRWSRYTHSEKFYGEAIKCDCVAFVTYPQYEGNIWVRTPSCGCLATWFCYQLIAKPGNKTATILRPDPYTHALSPVVVSMNTLYTLRGYLVNTTHLGLPFTA